MCLCLFLLSPRIISRATLFLGETKTGVEHQQCLFGFFSDFLKFQWSAEVASHLVTHRKYLLCTCLLFCFFHLKYELMFLMQWVISSAGRLYAGFHSDYMMNTGVEARKNKNVPTVLTNFLFVWQCETVAIVSWFIVESSAVHQFCVAFAAHSFDVLSIFILSNVYA